MYDHGLIAPVLALAAWTLVMCFWLYAVRIPAIRKLNLDPQEAERLGPRAAYELPRAAQRPAENYNHLHEQPTVFYAVALAAQLAGAAEPIAVGLAWAYVAIRIAHSLVQATANIITVRFLLFVAATFALLALLVRVAWTVFA